MTYTSSEPEPEPDRVAEALAWCEQFASAHAARDPLAAALQIPDLRRPLSAIYTYARIAADLATAPADPCATAAALDDLQDRVERAFHGRADEPLAIALDAVARAHALSIVPFVEMLDGARAELVVRPVATFEALVRRRAASTAPLARLLLHVAGDRGRSSWLGERFAIGLRLLDDLVDLGRDARAGRCALPSEDLIAFDVAPDDLLAAGSSPAMRELLAFSAARVEAMLTCGAALQRRAPAALQPLVGTLHRWSIDVATRLRTGALDPLAASVARFAC